MSDRNYIYRPYRDQNRFGNVKVTDTYDSTIFNKFMSEQDFEAAAAYAEQYKPTNTAKRMEWENYIHQLKKEGARLSHMTKGLNDDTKQAINFKYAVDNNLQLPGDYINSKGGTERNNYTAMYRTMMDNLGSSDKIKADKIAIRFDNDKNGNWFTRLIGLQEDEDIIDTFLNNLSKHNPNLNINKANMTSVLADAGITLISNANYHELQIDKSNPSILGVLKAYNDGLDRDKTSIQGIDSNGNYIEDKKFGIFTNDSADKGIYNSSARKNLITVTDLLRMVNDVEEKTKFINTKDDKHTKASTIIQSDNFMSQEHAVLYQQYENHEIDEQEYKTKLDVIENSIKGRLASSFEDVPILMSDSENGIMHYIDGPTREKLKDLYNIAAKNFSTNVITRVAQFEDKYGLAVEIKPEAKTDDNKSTYLLPGLKIDRNPNTQTIKFFIPDIETSSSMQALYSDPKSKAMLTLNDMKEYGYETNVSYIDVYGNNKDASVYNKQGQWYTYDYTSKTETPISAEFAQDMLARHYELNSINNSFDLGLYDINGNIIPNQINRNTAIWSTRISRWINRYYSNLDDKSKGDLGEKLRKALFTDYGIQLNEK